MAPGWARSQASSVLAKLRSPRPWLSRTSTSHAGTPSAAKADRLNDPNVGTAPTWTNLRRPGHTSRDLARLPLATQLADEAVSSVSLGNVARAGKTYEIDARGRLVDDQQSRQAAQHRSASKPEGRQQRGRRQRDPVPFLR